MYKPPKGIKYGIIGEAELQQAMDEDDRLIGTVKTVTDAQNMIMTANLANATVDNKDLYNINPITVIMSFER